MMRLPRTIRLDRSDAQVFEHAAEPGEWAVTGSFAFLDLPQAALVGKRGQAFKHGWLGTRSFGWSTLVMVANAAPGAIETATDALANHFMREHGAPDQAEARSVAEREIEFAASLCEHEPGTLLTVFRQLGPDGIVEQFATVLRDPEPSGGVDLLALAARLDDEP